MDQVPPSQQVRIGFLLLPNFTMMAFTSAVEPLRMANWLSGHDLFKWSVISLDGQAPTASNGLSMMPTSNGRDQPFDIVFVCSGINVREAVSAPAKQYLQELSRQKVSLGALCTGTYVLAATGLLDGYRCAIHWENLASVREEFPRITFVPELFVIDRDRYTCSGGIAPLDLVLNIVERHFGKDLAVKISEQFICDRIRDAKDRQHIPLMARVGANQWKILEVASLMEANTEEPLSIDDLAHYVGLSCRQLERLFKKYLGCAPTQYYMEQRLTRARQLLLQTDMSILDITVACGFQSAPHFSKSYRMFFGHPPSEERRARASGAEHRPSAQPARQRMLATEKDAG